MQDELSDMLINSKYSWQVQSSGCVLFPKAFQH